MAKAIKAVTEEGLSIRKASLKYGVPKSTLGDRISGRIRPGCVSGPPKLLTDDEEEELEKFIYHCAAIGYGKTRKDVLCLVNRFLLFQGTTRTSSVSSGWLSSFLKRHPSIVLRTPACLGRARYLATNDETLKNYFDLLEKTMEKHKLTDKPCLIFNMDESGMPLSPKPLKILGRRGIKNPSAFTSSDKAQVTVVGCVSAAGQCIPPMVVWDRKQLNPALAKGEIPGTIYGLTSNGWMDMELFHMWFKRHFLRYCPSARPVLLLMDGHSSHYSIDTIKLAAEDDVIVFVLPPNTTHMTQPLDKGIFGPLKNCWREECHDYLLSHPGSIITRYEFSQLFSKAWMTAMTMKNIRSGFATTGVFPVNRTAIQLPITSSVSTSKKVSFIPIYTPSKRRTASVSDSDFPESDLELFEKCYNEGFDLSKDIKYKKWLRIYHPDDVSCSESEDNEDYHPFPYQNWMEKFLDYPSPPRKSQGTEGISGSARVLTNSENLQILEAKKQEKEEKERKKKEKLEERKSKQAMKASKGKAISSACACNLKIVL